MITLRPPGHCWRKESHGKEPPFSIPNEYLCNNTLYFDSPEFDVPLEQREQALDEHLGFLCAKEYSRASPGVRGGIFFHSAFEAEYAYATLGRHTGLPLKFNEIAQEVEPAPTSAPLYVINLPNACTLEEAFRLCRECGPIYSIELSAQRDNSHTRWARVDYFDSSHAEAARAQIDGKVVSGQHVQVVDKLPVSEAAISEAEARAATPDLSPEARATLLAGSAELDENRVDPRSIFFTRLHPTVRRQDLWDACAKIAHVTNAKVFLDYGKNVSKCCGLVNCISREHAQKLLAHFQQAESKQLQTCGSVVHAAYLRRDIPRKRPRKLSHQRQRHDNQLQSASPDEPRFSSGFEDTINHEPQPLPRSSETMPARSLQSRSRSPSPSSHIRGRSRSRTPDTRSGRHHYGYRDPPPSRSAHSDSRYRRRSPSPSPQRRSMRYSPSLRSYHMRSPRSRSRSPTHTHYRPRSCSRSPPAAGPSQGPEMQSTYARGSYRGMPRQQYGDMSPPAPQQQAQQQPSAVHCDTQQQYWRPPPPQYVVMLAHPPPLLPPPPPPPPQQQQQYMAMLAQQQQQQQQQQYLAMLAQQSPPPPQYMGMLAQQQQQYLAMLAQQYEGMQPQHALVGIQGQQQQNAPQQAHQAQVSQGPRQGPRAPGERGNRAGRNRRPARREYT
ncbi:hypothetical protein OC842_005399 [Tilletia horrida]|uniref:RRM domain-containing protein n=1 Tax=Tilletia horrida TaxID=155126 RepID=A0AAN6JIG5_9BASI|nr:hypothetical protein OC842_005399 [Tilletia horrida]